jgi:acetyl/propionyl-CoA carboxylase alpha subunit
MWRRCSPWPCEGHEPARGCGLKYHVTIGGRAFEVVLGPEGVTLDGRPVSVSLEHTDGTPVHGLFVDNRTYRVVADRDGPGRWGLRINGSVIEVDVVDERTKVIREMTGAGAVSSGPRPIVAPMPGMVVKVEVVEGDRVEVGQGIVIVEAMKMENELRATGAGIVSRVRVRAGDAVEKDQLLVELEPLPEGGQ